MTCLNNSCLVSETDIACPQYFSRKLICEVVEGFFFSNLLFFFLVWLVGLGFVVCCFFLNTIPFLECKLNSGRMD